MHSYGPVVAIGHPGERLPPLGAARIHVDDADWHTTVSDLAAKARLVPLRPADTKAVLWEAATAAGVAGSDKIALYVRDLEPGVWTGFIHQLGDTLGAPLPPDSEPAAILLDIQARHGAHPATGTPGIPQLARTILSHALVHEAAIPVVSHQRATGIAIRAPDPDSPAAPITPGNPAATPPGQ